MSAAKTIAEKAVVLQLLARDEVQVQQIAGDLAIPSSTVASILQRLAKRGLVAAGKPTINGRGRPGGIYRLRLAAPVAVCQFDGTQLVGSVVQPDLTVSGIEQIDVAPIRDLEQALELARKLFSHLKAPAGSADGALAGVALAINAVYVGRQTLSSSVLPWAHNHVEESFEKALGVPVRVVVPMWGLAEYQRLEDPLPSSLACLEVGDGVGVHLVINGRVYTGGESLAGEVGHVTLRRDGPRCGCGRRGCLEAFCSGPAIVRRVLAGLSEGAASDVDRNTLEQASPRAGIEHIWQAWSAGDSLSRAVMDEVFDDLAWGLGLIVNIVDPAAMVAVGYVLEGKAMWREEIERRAHSWILTSGKRHIHLQPSRATLEDQHRVIACEYFFHEFLNGQPPLPQVNGASRRPHSFTTGDSR